MKGSTANTSTGPLVSDRKKRALEALEQRFTASKAQKEQRAVKAAKHQPVATSQKEQTRITSVATLTSLASPPLDEDNAANSAQKKASNSWDGNAHPIYTNLPATLIDDLVEGGAVRLDGSVAVNNIMYDIVQKGVERGKVVKASKKLKLDQWILLDNYVPPKGVSLAEAQKKALISHSKRSLKHMSMKEHRKCGSFDMPKESLKFDLFKPMHEMWKVYIKSVTEEKGTKLLERLRTADLHGAFVQVAECKVATLQGVNGMIIRDTTETFGIISQDNCFRVVPKAGSVFVLQADRWKITIYGNQLSQKAMEKEGRARQRLQRYLSK